MTRLALLSMACAVLISGPAWSAGDEDARKNTAPAFAFTALTDQPGRTLVSSAIVRMPVFGGAAPVPVTIAGDGVPALRVCADAACETVLRAWEAAKTWRRIRAHEKAAELLGGARYEDGIAVPDDPPQAEEEQREAA